MKLILLFTLFLFSAAACPVPEEKKIELSDVAESINTPPSYTQGFIYYDGFIYESSGIYGKSKLLRVNPKTGAKHVLNTLPKHIFGEGLAKFGDYLYQFSWKEEAVFIYKYGNWGAPKLAKYPGEAWGVTTYENKLLLSDGTPQLHLLNPNNLQIERSINVLIGNQPLEDINELENISGKIWANTWGSNFIHVIDTKTGCVHSKLDLTLLYNVATKHVQSLPEYDPWEHVLNGIANDTNTGDIFITGKNWSKIFVIQIDQINF
ncbi:MAG: glutamine cyclotransferase [Halobacteriovoraceae bacterium]|nr:glutamine cyclotransferase [Halobacteriovoraceae bacterium]|tara:strand:- start:1963 stop:2751 length:789 start_codon:yes stop_codon:yes gene_type:complete